MEKFKNFIYDKSDLFVALLIVAIAALVIWFGISNIMDPEKSAAAAQKGKAQTEQAEEPATEEPTTTAAVTTDAATATPPATTTEGATKASKIIISVGETSDQIAEKLIASGAITDKETFFAKLEELGLSSKIQLGTFEIPANTTLEDVCKIITKTN